MRPQERILIVGCGGIGAICAAAIAERGFDVTVSTTNEAIANAVARDGLRIRGLGPERRQRVRVVLGVPPGETFSHVILAMQPPQVEAAALDVKAALEPGFGPGPAVGLDAAAERGVVVCLQNGLCEERVARVLGAPERVLGGVVAWGASMLAPGVYERTAPGGFTLGRLDGRPLGTHERGLVPALQGVGPVDVTTNLLGKRWSKLAINCAISSLGTISGDRLGVLIRHRFVRRLALEIMTEVKAVADLENVHLEKVGGTIDLAWMALKDAERTQRGSLGLAAKHAALLAVGARYRRMRSSMLSAIERGRAPAVDFLNGEVVTRARHHGSTARVNDLVVSAVWRISRGQSKPGFDALRELYDKCSAHSTGG